MSDSQTKRLQESRALVLAAGKGTRMKSELPKVALPLAQKPMLIHVLEKLIQAGIKHITLVVGYKKEEIFKLVPEYLPDLKSKGVLVEYVEQAEQKGTAHAVLMGRDALSSFQGLLLVTNGDMPLLQAKTFSGLLETHVREGFAATVLSSRLENPFGYGRLVRDENGNLERIVEEKDATDEIRKIQEVNSGTYVFESPGIFTDLTRIGSNNKQNEYYLPDIMSLLRGEGKAVGSLVMDNPDEALGANSKEDLTVLEEKFKALA